VLNIGDSFLLAGFAQALKPKMKELGARYEVKSEQSSFTVSWASKMELVVANTQPDLVIINLGANEMSNTDPKTHAPAVRRIVKSIGDRPCVWVSPPSWRKDTGILDVIRESSAPCRFFDSDEHVKENIPRQSDKIHPNPEGGAIWAAAFWKWLHEQRAPAEPAADGAKKPNPWKLKPAPPEEHQPRNKK
jgi:lysophospholipase L1-like esterase